MATSNTAPSSAGPTQRAPRRRRWRLLLALAALIGVLAFAFRAPLAGFTSVGASYGARVGCSCRYVAGRSLDDCAKDKEPGMELVMLSEDVGEKTVTARFPLIPGATARYREGWGCVLEPWEE